MGLIKGNTSRRNPPGSAYGNATIIIGASALFGWMANFPILKSVFPKLVQINPVSAILFVLSGFALLHVRSHKRLILFLYFPSLLICFVSLLKLSIFVTGWDSHIDTLLFHNSLDGDRMAPNTAVNFVLSSLSLILISRKSDISIIIGQVFTLFCFLISVLAIMGNIYSIRSLYAVSEYMP